MVIVVYTRDGERCVCEGAARFRTDEHNNLEVLGGSEELMVVFNASSWDRVQIENDEDDGEGSPEG